MSTSINETDIPEQITRHLLDNEVVISMAETATVPLGFADFVPLIGSLLQLGRACSLKPHYVVITNKRLLLIQYNRLSIARGFKELGFNHYPIEEILTADASKPALDIEFDACLKIALKSGEKFTFRKLSIEEAQEVCESINEVKKGSNS
jgi:hypothetical protein